AAGIMVDGAGANDALFAIGSASDWVVRAINAPGCRPLSFLGGKPASVLLRSWPQSQIVKCFVPRADDVSSELQNERLRELQYAVEMWGHELMLVPELETGSNKFDPADRIREIQAIGMRPDWWGVESTGDASAWGGLQSAIEASNPMCRGVLMVDAGCQDIVSAYRDASAACPLLQGIVAGKSTYAQLLLDWEAGRSDDARLAQGLRAGIDRLVAGWPRGGRS